MERRMTAREREQMELERFLFNVALVAMPLVSILLFAVAAGVIR